MKNKKMSAEEIYAVIRNILGKNMNVEDNGDGTYGVAADVDHDEELSLHQLGVISESNRPREMFYGELDDYAYGCEDYEKIVLIQYIEARWDDEEYGDFNAAEEVIRDFISENVQVNFPYDHFLEQKILVNLIVDAGDANYDYTLNHFAQATYDDDRLYPESGLVWLVRQQGYEVKQLVDAVNAEEKTGDKFIDSIVQESASVTTSMNALVFSVTMSLDDFIGLKEKKVDITLGKGTSAGLHDFWNGAGGSKGIRLQNDVVLPHSLYSAHIEGNFGLDLMDVYGLDMYFWTDTIISMEVRGDE